MKQFYLTLIGICSLHCSSNAQFAPQAGLAGSTAISATSAEIVNWARQCTVQRGYRDIADHSLGYAIAGDTSQAIGPADGGIVSLGDSGVAVLTFNNPIINGPGADFAVFENGFLNTSDASQAFLELAFVEVSSDGVNYTRFPATSNTQANVQLGNPDYLDATLLNNLAGKYVANYGTPFDLQELSGIAGLDINNITHVRLVDVVGSISAHASRDHNGAVINDPYPTPFAAAGFDLDAVGVLHQWGNASVTPINCNASLSVYPSPAYDVITISLDGTTPTGSTANITTVTGSMVQRVALTTNKETIQVASLPAGMYYVTICDTNGNKWVQKFVKN